jgi:hypothetical protein
MIKVNYCKLKPVKDKFHIMILTSERKIGGGGDT